MLPTTPKTLFFLLLLYDNLFVSRAGKYKDCIPSPLGSDFEIRGIGDWCIGISNTLVEHYDIAKKECISRKAILAEPYTITATRQLTSFALALRRSTWIGVVKDPKVGWTFLTNPALKNYEFIWAFGEPNGDGICVHMNSFLNYEWNDLGCECPGHNFACQIEREWTECFPNPCEHGGTCEDVKGPVKYRCNCIPGTTGQNCSIDVDECESNPCVGDGECDQSISLNKYICICKDRRLGDSCQYELPDKPEHNCEPYVFVGESLTCTCSTKNFGNPKATVGFLLGKDEYTPTLYRSHIAADDDGMEFRCGLIWQPEGQKSLTGEKKYKLAIAYGPTDRDTSITGPKKLLTDGESGLTVTLTCSSFWAYPEPIVFWEEVKCEDGNFAPECRFKINDDVKEMNILCTLKNPIKLTVVGKANHTLRIDSSRNSVITIRVLRIADEENPEAKPGQSMTLVCEAFGGDPHPASLEVYHTPGATDLGKATAGTKLSASGISTPKRAVRKTYSIKASDICGSMDAYRCETKAVLEGDVVIKFIGLKTNCSIEAPEAPDGAPVAPIAAGAGSSLLALLVAAFLLWKRRNQAQETINFEPREQPLVQEEDDVFKDNPSEAAPTEDSTESASLEEGGEANEASEEQSEEKS